VEFERCFSIVTDRERSARYASSAGAVGDLRGLRQITITRLDPAYHCSLMQAVTMAPQMLASATMRMPKRERREPETGCSVRGAWSIGSLLLVSDSESSISPLGVGVGIIQARWGFFSKGGLHRINLSLTAEFSHPAVGCDGYGRSGS